MPPSFFYILLSIIVFSIILSWVKSNSIINPVTFFILWWGFFVFLSGLDLAGIRMPRDGTYNLIFMAMIMFSLGGITFLSSGRKLYDVYTYNNILTVDLTKSNSKLKYFLNFQLVITVILIVFLNKGLGMLKSFDAGTYRYLVYTEYGIFQGHNILLNYILRPSLFIGTFITISGILLQVVPKRYLILSVLNIFLYSVVILGRSSIVLLIICFFLGLLYFITVNRSKIKKKYVLLILIPIIFIISMSIFRKSTHSSKTGIDIVTNYFVWYLTGPFTAFDYFLNTYKEGVDYNFTFFRTVFSGIEDLLDPFIKKVFPEFNKIFEKFVDILGTYRDLGGPATHHNSHYTMLFSFFMDAGVAGVIFFPYILGSVIALVYNSFRKNVNLFNFSILILLTYLSMMGSTRWEMMFSWPWMIIFGSFIITKKISFKKEY